MCVESQEQQPETPAQITSQSVSEGAPTEADRRSRRRLSRRDLLLAPYSLLLGFGGGLAGFLLWQRLATPPAPAVQKVAALYDVPAAAHLETSDAGGARRAFPDLPDRYDLGLAFGDIGPRLVEHGAIDLPRFVQLHAQSGQSLVAAQMAMLTTGSNAPVVIDRHNAHFLLNFLWAFGLANQNPILTEGAMVGERGGNVMNFASTGGWTLATRPVAALYASLQLVTLTSEQQCRLKRVAAAVYRPCCDNSTAFPDCNHGMAMLGVMELMAAHDAGEETMLDAAKFVNAFWFPAQMGEIAALLEITGGGAYTDAPSSQIVGATYSSSSGFQAIHRQLAASGNLPATDAARTGCGV